MFERVRKFLINPRLWQWYHGVWATIWLLSFGPGMTIFKESVPFLMFISLQTALSGSLAGFVASIGARKADPEDKDI